MLSKLLLTINPLSKAGAFILFILLLVITFFLGTLYQKTRTPIQYVEKFVSVPMKEVPDDLVDRCGYIQDEVYSHVGQGGHFSAWSGPEWSPDCRYIAWSIRLSGTGWLGEIPKDYVTPTRTLNPVEGVYLYNDRTRQITKIYSPTQLDETPTFKEWKDRNNLIFSTSKGQFIYNIKLKTVEGL